MCGIAGGIGIERGAAERMRSALLHRGPDGSGLEQAHASGDGPPGEVWLAHTRLAVIDLTEAASQPMRDPITGASITFNGEIYNHKELRQELEAAGERFYSASDTEVVLRAYVRWGSDCLHRLRGMFAFAVWRPRDRSLFAARDRLGVKPFYYHSDPVGERLLFASEVRALLASGLVERRFSSSGLESFLRSGSVEEPLTLVEGVRSLPPGHSATWRDGRLTLHEYWDIPLAPSEDDLADAVERVPDLIATAVKRHTVSDVPLALFLSGGIDSGALASFLSQSGPRPRTFSVAFGGGDLDESAQAAATAEAFGTDHTVVGLDEATVAGSVAQALRSYDQPSADGVNTFVLSGAVRQAGLKVALSGLGGDEVFAGYPGARSVPRLESGKRWLSRAPWRARQAIGGAFQAAARDERHRRLGSWISSLGRSQNDHPYYLTRTLFGDSWREALLSAEGTSRWDESPVALRHRLLTERAAGTDAVNRYLYLESRNYLSNTLLRDSDAMSMAHGLELRVPLLDHDLVEGVARIPGALKLSSEQTKPLLVGALPQPLPASVTAGAKRGFTLPWDRWLHGELGARVRDRLHDGSPSLDGLLQIDNAPAVWDAYEAGTLSWSRVWALYALYDWSDRHMGGRRAAE